jgi:branched-chain amino acid transport system ATP-binding protein
VLKVEELHTYYGESHILQGIDLEVRPGEVVALLGRNGMGKTTTIRSIIGQVRPRRGRVIFQGKDVAGRPPEEIARLGVGLVPQGRGIFPNLTVTENLTLAARKGEWTLSRIYDLFPRLRERGRNRGSQLSGGEQEMLAIARALMMNPSLLLMDEPSEGLAPLVIREVGEVIRRLKGSGASILLVEQNLPLALGVADRVYLLSKGKIVHACTPDELRHDDETKRTYLGV